MDINIKINKVKEILKNKKIALAFSAGADSTLLAYLAKEAGADVLAITYNNQIFPSGFLEFAKRRASEIGIRHEIIEGNFFLDMDEFVENCPRRCLLCRNLMYDAIKQKAHEEGYEIIIDGNNITDLTHDRPGILMNYKYEIESPFIEAELETYEIHQFLEDNHIEFSKATTCLATRVKTNEIVTIDKVNRIDYCESFIKEKTNCDVVKLRENNNVATIELDSLETIVDIEKLESIFKELKEAQYEKILLNIDFNDEDEDLVLDEELEIGKSNFTLRKKLPFGINITETSKVLNEFDGESIDNIDSLEDIGYIKLNIDEKESKIFRDGKISIENNENKEDAKQSLVKILPLIRRTV